MSEVAYRYALELYRRDGTALGQVPAAVDFEPAREWVLFQGIRKNLVSTAVRNDAAVIRPLWHEEIGRPYVRGFAVEVRPAGAAGISRDFGTSFFKRVAEEASSRLIAEGKMENGEIFRYLTVAFPDARADTVSGQGGAARLSFQTEDVTPPLPLRQTPLFELTARASPRGSTTSDDMPAFLPQRVLEEAAALTRRAGACETGGLLIGHVHRDASVPEVFVEITAQLPARHTRAEASKLTFTAETWTAAQKALGLRRRGELLLGWWHSHPVKEWCKTCPPEKKGSCPLSRGFFSESDQLLHRTVFPRAYMVALVVTNVDPGRIRCSLFGWGRGGIGVRGFHLLGARAGDCQVGTADPRPSEASVEVPVCRGDRNAE